MRNNRRSAYGREGTTANEHLEHSEVHKARSKKSGGLVALKKIIMHNEKDGVSSRGPCMKICVIMLT